MKTAITMKELQEISKTKWIRPKKHDTNRYPNMDYPQYNLTLKYQDGWCFIWGAFLLNVNGAEFADTHDSKTWTSIELYGH